MDIFLQGKSNYFSKINQNNCQRSLFSSKIDTLSIFGGLPLYNNQNILKVKSYLSMVKDKNQKQNKPKSKKLSKIRVRKARVNSWTTQQQGLYLQFLKKHLAIMRNQETRRAYKVFKMMSDVIGTRSSIQVKTHHQKLEEKYQTTSNIIHHVELLIKKTLILQAQQRKKYGFQPMIKQQALNSTGEIEMDDVKVKNEQLSSSSFFNEQSQNYSHIECNIKLDENQPLI